MRKVKTRDSGAYGNNNGRMGGEIWRQLRPGRSSDEGYL